MSKVSINLHTVNGDMNQKRIIPDTKMGIKK